MKAINIKWDTDRDIKLLRELLSEMEIPEGVTDEDETGFCHEGFELVD